MTKDIRICAAGKREIGFNEELRTPTIKLEATRRDWADERALYMDFDAPARKPVEAVFIPYYAWANRNEGEMLVWTDIDR